MEDRDVDVRRTLVLMSLISEASTVHVPTVDGSAAPAPIVITMWL